MVRPVAERETGREVQRNRLQEGGAEVAWVERVVGPGS